jgi:hypothetical protein
MNVMGIPAVTGNATGTSGIVVRTLLHGAHAQSGVGGLVEQQALRLVREKLQVTTTQASSAQRPCKRIKTVA